MSHRVVVVRYGSDLANLVVDVARRPLEFVKETIAALDELRGSILELDLMAVTEAVLPDTTVLVKYWGPLAKHPQTKCQIAARSVIELAGTVFAVKGAANSLLKLKNLGRRHWTPAQARAQFGGGPNPGATPPPVPPVPPAAVGAPKSADPWLSRQGVRPAPGTRVRPQGVPENWRIRGTDTPGGVRYYDPQNPGHSVRVMQGSPGSPYPNSQAPYVRWQYHGQPLDVNGNVLPTARTPDAHIPLQDFKFNPEVYSR